MAYVATRGGENAIQQAERLFHELRGPISAQLVQSIMQSMPLLVDRVMSEGSLYAPELAALALAQTGGDLYESVLLLRAYRSTQPRLAYAETVQPGDLWTIRRISAAFKDIPGGQILGPTLDYSHRLLEMGILEVGNNNNNRDNNQSHLPEPVEPAEQAAGKVYPAVTDWQRAQGWLEPLASQNALQANAQENSQEIPQEIPDITREPLVFPAPRAHRLQMLARADTGGVLSLGYASMRGYGVVHPTVNELRLGYADVKLKHPVSGAVFSAGRVRVSQAEIVTTGGSSEAPGLELGFCATLGWNEVKVIAGSTLDLAMEKPDTHPAHSEEFVLYHTEAVESSGFCIHFKLPHYVTFTSSLDNLRGAKENVTRRMFEGQFVQTFYAGDTQAPGDAADGDHTSKSRDTSTDGTSTSDTLTSGTSNGHHAGQTTPNQENQA